MKKILILEGSPRKNGNTGILSGQFAKGAEQAGGCVEKIRVAEKKVSGCLGCGACEKNGGACIQKDDMEEIRAKMLAADSIVLASPIYFYSMTAQMKAVIDRTYAFIGSWREKRFIFSSPAVHRTFAIPKPCWRRCAGLQAACQTPKRAARCLG